MSIRVTGVEMGETKKGDPYKKVSLSNGANIGVFKWNSRYTDIEKGLELEEDEFHQKGDYINLTDPENGRPDGAKDPDFASVGASGKDAQQARREYSIKLTSTFRMATDIVVAKIEAGDYDNPSDEKIKQDIGRWRNWFTKEWENIGGEEPITPEGIDF